MAGSMRVTLRMDTMAALVHMKRVSKKSPALTSLGSTIAGPPPSERWITTRAIDIPADNR